MYYNQPYNILCYTIVYYIYILLHSSSISILTMLVYLYWCKEYRLGSNVLLLLIYVLEPNTLSNYVSRVLYSYTTFWLYTFLSSI
jgi:hypothetical protein